MRNGVLLFIQTVLLGTFCLAQEQTFPLPIDQKIKAFDEFEEQNRKLDKIRESDLEDLLEERRRQKKIREQELQEYLAEKRKEKKVKIEDTPAYEEYLLNKWEWRHSQEKAADEAIKIKRALKPGKKEREFEIREYALQETEKNRVPFNKRKLIGGRPGGGSTGGSGGYSGSGGNSNSYGGPGGGGAPPPYIPPPPIEDVPDFDNDIPPPPPPPPPPMGGNDFDEGEPVPIPPPPPPME